MTHFHMTNKEALKSAEIMLVHALFMSYDSHVSTVIRGWSLCKKSIFPAILNIFNTLRTYILQEVGVWSAPFLQQLLCMLCKQGTEYIHQLTHVFCFPVMMKLECTICKEEFSPSCELTTTNCGHLFHQGCILRWMGRWGTKPSSIGLGGKQLAYKFYMLKWDRWKKLLGSTCGWFAKSVGSVHILHQPVAGEGWVSQWLMHADDGGGLTSW